MDFRALRRTLKNKLGAKEDREGHHIYYYLCVGKQYYRVGKVSHSARGQVSDFIVADTAQRLRLSKQEFLQLVDCTIYKEDHTKLWQQRSP